MAIPKNLTEQFVEAANESRWGKVKRLLEAGADICADDNCALRRAASDGHTRAIDLLLDNGADINAMDGMPLYMAVMHQHPDAIKTLLKRGAEINDKVLQLARHSRNPKVQNAIKDFIDLKEEGARNQDLREKLRGSLPKINKLQKK